uniref:Peptidase M14 domain-containing protein n=1 Tax=Phlebotomus papatasi TaxID=29031 RepID=A0A1B0DRJ9_PHLPP
MRFYSSVGVLCLLFVTTLAGKTLNIPEKWHTVDFTHFWPVDEVNAYIDEVAEANPDQVQVITARYSREVRPINAVKISSDQFANRPVVFIEAGIRPRDWAGHMVAIRVMHEFFSHYYNYLDVLEEIDIIIMPVSNPDGYEFSRNEDRGWTKNRQLNVGSDCVGVSVYHNFAPGFYVTPDPCEGHFSGPSAMSEQESRAVNHILEQFNVIAFFSLQAGGARANYGSNILYPFGYRFTVPPNEHELFVFGDALSNVFRQAGGRRYSVGPAHNLWYDPHGNSLDHASEVRNITFPYTIEMPYFGEHGYDIVESEIEPLVESTLPGFIFIVNFFAGLNV